MLRQNRRQDARVGSRQGEAPNHAGAATIGDVIDSSTSLELKQSYSHVDGRSNGNVIREMSMMMDRSDVWNKSSLC
jgi:hypothetical protein